MTGDVTTLLWVALAPLLFVSIFSFPGGDLTLFISGLQHSVNKVKEIAGEETREQSSSTRGVVA